MDAVHGCPCSRSVLSASCLLYLPPALQGFLPLNPAGFGVKQATADFLSTPR